MKYINKFLCLFGFHSIVNEQIKFFGNDTITYGVCEHCHCKTVENRVVG